MPSLTGRYCWRSRLKSGVQNGYGTPLIEKERPTVASHLKQAGYHTAVIGKWHLGLGFRKDAKGQWDWSKPLDHSPVDLGFDRSLVIPASLDFPPYVYVEGRKITGLPDRTQPKQGFPGYLREGELGSDFSIIDCLDRLTQESCDHIRKRSKEKNPFFLYFPLTAPHKPVSPHPRFQGKSKLGPYGDFVMQVDWTVGQVMKAVDDAGIKDNTLIIYTSDNASFMYRESDKDKPHHLSDETEQIYYEGDHTANGPWRGTKADVWEGGHRVPTFARWPKGIKAGTVCKETICLVDLFATASELAKAKLPKPNEAAPDSFSWASLFKGKPGQFRRAPVINHSAAGMFAIRMDEWKLVLGNGSGEGNNRRVAALRHPGNSSTSRRIRPKPRTWLPGKPSGFSGWRPPFFKFSPTTKAENKNHEQTWKSFGLLFPLRDFGPIFRSRQAAQSLRSLRPIQYGGACQDQYFRGDEDGSADQAHTQGND